MLFIINKEDILETLQTVVGPTTTKQNFPVLNSVLLSKEDNKLKFTTTDLDITIVAYKDVTVTEEGKIAIPMKRFLSIVRELPNGEITVETKKNNLLIRCEKIEFKVNLLDAQDFPKIEEEKRASLIKLSPEYLEEMIKLTSFCVGHEEVNYVLGGILFEITGDTIKLVATDGRRLSYIERKLPATQPDITTKISFIVPIKAINELYKLIKERTDDVFLFVEENKIGLDLKNIQFVARPIEGEFPDYSQYVPKESKNKLIINRQKILYALRRADLLSTPDYQGVKISLKKDAVTISKTTPQLGEVKEEIDAQYNGASFELGLNPQYVLDVLKNLDDEEVVFEFTATDKPVVLRKENYVYLVLPMKI
jgi:DNA polymerase-3 subunit beta